MHNTVLDPTIAPRSPLPRKRGRPRTVRPMRDSGTAELIMKRLNSETTEALDLCLERGIIDQSQHWCGVHLRWLYTLRFGAPGVRAVDPAHLGGMETKPHDEKWASSREEEYQSALAHLSRSGHAALVMNICIFNEKPAFLLKPANLHASKVIKMAENFTEGLDILKSIWCSNNSR